MDVVKIIKLIYQISDILIYLAYYFYIVVFTFKHRKAIYKAACGGNGMPQPNELAKLFSVFALPIYINEIIHYHVVFDVNIGLFLLGCIGIANLGKFNLDKVKNVFNGDYKKEE